MTKTFISLSVILMLALLPGASALDLKVLSNGCIYDQKLGKDRCETVYQVAGAPALDAKDLSKNIDIQFKTDTKGILLGAVLPQKATLTGENMGKDFKLVVSGTKSPFINIDNIPCIDGRCYPEYIWWNATRPYYKRVDINASDGWNLTDYPIFLENLSYYGFFNGLSRSDFQDVWFYSNLSDTAKKLDYCMGKECLFDNRENYRVTGCYDGQSCDFWVNVPEINGSIYISWGDPSSLSYSNPYMTFQYIYYADGASINTTTPNWGRQCDSEYSESGGTINQAFAGTGNRWCSTWFNLSRGQLAEAYAKSPSNTNDNWMPMQLGSPSDVGNVGTIYCYSGSCNEQYFGATTITIRSITESAWYYHAAFNQFNNITSSGDSFIDINGTRKWFDDNNSYLPGGFTLNGYPATVNAKWDWVRVRNFHYPEPLSSIGNIVSNITIPEKVPVINISLACDTCKDLPIRYSTCTGNDLKVIRERKICDDIGCKIVNQTDITDCAFGCEENITRYGADCAPTSFETNIYGWLAIISILIAIFTLPKLYSIGRSRRRGRR